MQAAIIDGERNVVLREFPDPTPAPDGVVVDVAFCGICGTDVHAYTSGRPYRAAVCGHEWMGTVSAAGSDVSSVSEGDRVVVGVPEPCGRCAQCRAGNTAHCAVVVDMVHGRDATAPAHGGFAPRISVTAGRVVAANPSLDDETLAQVEPVTVALHAVNRSELGEGDTAVVLGSGPVGLTTMQCAAAAGAGQVLVVEPDSARRTLAESLGATAAATPEAAADIVADRTGGLGADVVYECVGSSEALGAAVGLGRRGATVCLVGLATGQMSIEPGEWLRNEVTVTAALGYLHHEFADAMDLLADGRVQVRPLHTSTTRVDALAATLEELAVGGSGQLKVLVNPNWVGDQ